MSDFERGRIRFIRGGRYPHCHSVFIDDEIRTIIDPASDEARLLALHRECPIQIIINSHGHEDHFLYNSRFPDARLWVHALDAAAFGSLDDFCDQFFDPEDMNEETKGAWSKFFTEQVKFKPRTPDRFLEDGEILEFGETIVRVLHTPGHSPGHLSFHFPEEKVLYLADLDLVRAGPYYGDKASSIEDTIQSCHRLAAIEVDVYLVAHGKEGVIEGDPARIHRYVDVIRQREERILDFLVSGPRHLDEIVAQGIIYGKRTVTDGAWELSLSEKSMIRKHLDRLEGHGAVKMEDGFYRLT
jgi:glyoxylase-like metal-dependent hydrolase (beta-lactamase superfamily II)